MNQFVRKLIHSKSRYRSYLLALLDMLAVAAGYCVSGIILLLRQPTPVYMDLMLKTGVIFVFIYLIVFYFFNMYNSLWRYAEVTEFFKCLMASATAEAVFVCLTLLLFRKPRIPISVYMMSAMIAMVATLFYRMAYRLFRDYINRSLGALRQKRVLLVGAGTTGATVINEFNRGKVSKYVVVSAVDSDISKVGKRINGVKVEGTDKDIPELVKKLKIDVIVITIPTAKKEDRIKLLNICADTGCQLRIIPEFVELVTGGDFESKMRSVSVEDLLGRETVETADSYDYLKNKCILVTGGGGSIGSELCRQIAQAGPKRLVILDIYENNAYCIQQELLRKYGNTLQLDVEICSVKDEAKMRCVFQKYLPDIVFHAAAHKHVPLMEHNPEEAVKNNIYGTLNVAKFADEFGVKRFILISTDKAVRPTNVMGATKRICELIIQSFDSISDTEYAAVRFGNVLGSNGSVIPLFKAQIAEGGPVTVTHPEITRFFMTIPEAVSLVIKAGEMARGGEIFALDMGEPVKILKLAEDLIRLSGHKPYEEIPIRFVGLRPGEKLYEEILIDRDKLGKTANSKIFVERPQKIYPQVFFELLEALRPLAYQNDVEVVYELIHRLVPEFHTESAAVSEQTVGSEQAQHTGMAVM